MAPTRVVDRNSTNNSASNSTDNNVKKTNHPRDLSDRSDTKKVKLNTPRQPAKFQSWENKENYPASGSQVDAIDLT